MSGFVSEPPRSDEQLEQATFDHEYSLSPHGQRHDRMPSHSLSAREDMTSGIANDNEEISAGQKVLSAMSGSLLTSLLFTPLDVVRVRLQSQSQPSKARPTASTLPNKLSFSHLPPNIGVTQCCREVFWVNNSSSYCLANGSATSTYTALNPAITSASSSVGADCAVDEVRQKNFNSALDGLRKIARNEGLTSLWRGLSPTLVMAIPANVIYFTGYDALRWNHSSPIRNRVPDTYAPLIAGSVARVAAAATTSPIEMFRTRMQAATSSSRGAGVFKDTILGMKDLVRTQGITSIWRGLTLTMWRDVPFSGLYWWGYETIRTTLAELRESGGEKLHRDHAHAPTFVDSFISGATSGAVASILTTPFDVGKTRQQVAQHSNNKASAPSTGAKDFLRPEERSMPRFLYSILKDEGLPGLFRGWAARTMKVAPACAIMISSYEVGKKMARRMNERSRAETALS